MPFGSSKYATPRIVAGSSERRYPPVARPHAESAMLVVPFGWIVCLIGAREGKNREETIHHFLLCDLCR
jgi:hypothetical protein